jgi:cation:H+ antiporter
MDWNAEFIWTQFFLCSAAIVFAGTKITRYGDRIAQLTGLGRLWVGAVLLSIVTSLPEMVTACSSAWLGEPDIALQNVIGSNLFNILVLVMLDFLIRRRCVLAEADPGHRGSAFTGTAMMLVVAAAALFFNLAQDRGQAFETYSRIPVGLDSLGLGVIYVWAMWRIFRVGRRERKRTRNDAPAVETGATPGMKASHIYVVFLGAAVVILAAGYRMTVLGSIISETPLNIAGRQVMITDNFVGMILIAIATSLPELVVTISAARMGAADLAVGNILGSNIFNMAIITMADGFYFHGPILLYAGRAVFYTALLGSLISAVALHGIGRPARRLVFSRLGPHSLAILLIYAAGMLFLTWSGLLVS